MSWNWFFFWYWSGLKKNLWNIRLDKNNKMRANKGHLSDAVAISRYEKCKVGLHIHGPCHFFLPRTCLMHEFPYFAVGWIILLLRKINKKNFILVFYHLVRLVQSFTGTAVIYHNTYFKTFYSLCYDVFFNSEFVFFELTNFFVSYKSIVFLTIHM